MKNNNEQPCNHSGPNGKRVAMLVYNPGHTDARVVKSARALLEGGWDVTIVSLNPKSEPPGVKVIDGIRYFRIGASRTGIVLFSILHFLSLISRYAGRALITTLGFNENRLKKSLLAAVRKLYSRIFPRLTVGGEAEMHAGIFEYLNANSPYIIHCHDLVTLPVGSLLANKFQAKVIYDSHELESQRNSTYSKLMWQSRYELEKRLIVEVDHVITVSNGIADYLQAEFGIKKPSVIFNAPYIDAPYTKRNLFSDVGVPHSSKICVYLGNVSRNRGIEAAIHAMKLCPEIHFALVGKVQSAEYKATINAIVNQHGVRDRVHYIDPVPSNFVVDYVSSASVSIIPIQNTCLSYFYCMPNKLFESVFAGVPVVVSSVSDMVEFVKYFKCGVSVDETNPEAIASGIRSVLDSPDSFKIDDSLKEVLFAKYSWTSQAEKLRDIYVSL